MDIRFENGCTVTRAWGDNETELLAAFQYENGAISFARQQAADDNLSISVYYIVHNNYNGKVTIVRRVEADKTAA